jgi:acetyl esterase/lipase
MASRSRWTYTYHPGLVTLPSWFSCMAVRGPRATRLSTPRFSYSAVSRSRASTSVHQNDARFPTDVYDIKAGKRFLRARAADYGYRSDRIDIVGASSGGHLAALVGVTNVLMRLVNAAGRR